MSPEPGGTPAAGWGPAFFSLIHPVKIAAVEAFAWTREPLSALLVYEVLGRDWPFGTVAYHVRRLAEAGVLVERYSEPRRGAREHFYALAP
jgi:hypothetical protein